MQQAPQDPLQAAAQSGDMNRLFTEIVARAVERGASDVHLEPTEDGMNVRIRVHGLLEDLLQLTDEAQKNFIRAVKVKFNIDSTARLPQDGRYTGNISGHEFHLRGASMPQVHGDKMVLRILDKGQMMSIDQLGLSPQNLAGFRHMLERPHGLVLITGPTGSGKTTTLYAALSYLMSPHKNICTVEDPVEFYLQGVNQVQVHSKIGLTFSSVLQALLRQDPDIIMVGEIRDKDTAEIAIHAALTGHLVLSTLHTNNTVGAIARLIDLGVTPFLLCSALNGVMAQRLAQRLCPSCRQPMAAPYDSWYQARGCSECQGKGSQGRVTVQELLPMTDEFLHAIMSLHAIDATQLNQLAVNTGMVSLQDDALHKAMQGLLTYQEAVRVTQGHIAEASQQTAEVESPA